jgi:hypothetical protein
MSVIQNSHTFFDMAGFEVSASHEARIDGCWMASVCIAGARMAWISSPNPARASKCFYLFDQSSARLGVSAHSSKDEKQSAELIEANSEIQRLRPQMRRLEVERDLLKRARWVQSVTATVLI